MKPKMEFGIIATLMVVILGLGFLLVRETRNRTPQSENEGSHWIAASTPERVAAVNPVLPERDRDPFAPIVTPKPTETRVVVPTATITPTPLAARFQVPMILSKVVQVIDPNGKKHYLKEGDSLDGLIIEEVNAAEDYIVVRHSQSGRTRRMNRVP
jgi:hypothetical protein